MSEIEDNGDKEQGYSFYPKQYDHAPGFPRLDIILRAIPTEMHFDPEHVWLTIAAVTLPEADIEHLLIHHNWHGRPQYRACAGTVRMTDRRGKIEEAFTFGGDIAVHAEEDKTIVTLTSPAPILHLFKPPMSSITSLLAAEVQVLLAERGAVWLRQKPGEFEHRLANADPLTLYRSCIEALKDRFHDYPDDENESIKAFRHFLQFEASYQTGQAGGPPQLLADIL